MERLLAKKGIELVSYIPEDGLKISYAFTEEMLNRRIAIVITEYNSEWIYYPEEEDEEVYEEAGETDNSEESDSREEDDSDADEEYAGEEEDQEEEWSEESEPETKISVVYINGKIAWTFSICKKPTSILDAISLYGIVKDLIEIITESNPEDLTDDLESIAAASGISNEFTDDPEVTQYLFDYSNDHIENAIALLNVKRAAE